MSLVGQVRQEEDGTAHGTTLPLPGTELELTSRKEFGAENFGTFYFITGALINHLLCTRHNISQQSWEASAIRIPILM